ncbi:hypothetical protein CSPX01_05158, partial [Colletotrichum filicis]
DGRAQTGRCSASELKSRATRAGRASWAHLYGRASHLRKGRGLAIEDTITATLRHRAFSWLAVLSTAFPATRPFFVVAKTRTIPCSTQSRCLGREQRPPSTKVSRVLHEASITKAEKVRQPPAPT